MGWFVFTLKGGGSFSLAKPNSALKLVVHPQEYFHELVLSALSRQNLKPLPETEFYLVNLLNHFIVTDHLYARDASGNIIEEPLALQFMEALELQHAQERRAVLRFIGDVALYVSGFFQDSLTRKRVDVDYYISMGKQAYGNVIDLEEERARRAVYAELSERFSKFVDVLAEIGEKTQLTTEKDLLRVYDLWVRTGSERAAESLKRNGIIPNQTVKKAVQ